MKPARRGFPIAPDIATAIIHNMSVPPKSIVRYAGLSGLATQLGPGGSGVCAMKYAGKGVFGSRVLVTLPDWVTADDPAALLRELGIVPEADPLAQLEALIERRAGELPLPDGCLVMAAGRDGHCLWPDALSALAVLTKCSEFVWLRDKTPNIHGLKERRSVSLVVPPGFASKLKEPFR